MKRFLLLFLAIMLTASFASAAEPQEDIEIIVDGETIHPEVPPRIIEGRTIVPARFIFEPLGAEMEWDGENRIASGILGDIRVEMPIDSKEATVNGETETLDVPAQIFEGRTYIPLRFSGEAFGGEVDWDGFTSTVTITMSDEMSDESEDNKETKTEREKLSAEDLVELVNPSIVKIETQRGHGSGFFISEDGKIATNAHVVRGSKWIEVITQERERYSAEIKKIDNASDLSILNIDAQTTFSYISEFSFKENLSTGEEVIAFGNPLDYEYTVTRGIVGGIEDWKPDAWFYPDHKPMSIQHDATIAPGSSGGPLFNLYGELVGVNVTGDIFGFNFALPSDKLDSLISWGDSYNLEYDYRSFWTEHYTWEERYADLLDLFDRAVEAQELNLISDANFYYNEILSQENQLYEQVSNYYPKYTEIQNLKQLRLDKLNAFEDYIEYSTYTLNYPYEYSSREANRLYSNWESAVEDYYNKINEYNEKYIENN